MDRSLESCPKTKNDEILICLYGVGPLETIARLVFPFILCLVKRYVLKMIKLYFHSIADGRIVVPVCEWDPEQARVVPCDQWYIAPAEAPEPAEGW